MNIEKIKNYNQKLLAVLGTIAVLLAILALIASFFDLSRSFSYATEDEGILSEEKIEELQKEHKRQQIVSYESPKLVDSLNLVYVIPVSHKTLVDGELVNEEGDELLNLVTGSKNSKKYDSRYAKQYYGDFNNLIVYDYKNETNKKLFDERINFDNFEVQYFDDDILVLLKASNKDTYKDGVINQKDYKSLFVYSLKKDILKEIKLKNADAVQYNFIENSKDLIITFGIDYDKDGMFNERFEPTIIKKYNFEKGELLGIINKNIDKELQAKLEGTK